MSDSDHDNWLGYLVSVFVDETMAYSKECCPGCLDKKNSPLLHTHNHSGLLEKLYMFHPLVKETMLSKISNLVSDYVNKFPDPEIYDDSGQKVLRAFGRDFLLQSSPKFIYYSPYLTPTVDERLTVSHVTIHTKPMNLKRGAAKMSKKKQPARKKAKKETTGKKTAI